jgi:sec-independent protein translocase protein TatC
MSLAGHITELRSRLLKAVTAIVLLGIASLVFSRSLFGFLMRPVLSALPPEGRSLIYTSGIEELNVLMKVGLYAGIFLATPVILWQLWGFISPGLYKHERRFAGPFVFLGSISFIAGAAFCYLVLLPPMFQFLLQDPDAAATEAAVKAVQRREGEAVRLFRMGELGRASEIAGKGIAELKSSPGVSPALEVPARLESLGRLIDAANDAYGVQARPVLQQVMDKQLDASSALERGDTASAGSQLDEAAALLAGVSPAHAEEISNLWKLEKAIAAGNASYAQTIWTRPMLTMREQLSLVLLLELALGIIFELPLVMALLAFIGLVTSRFLFKYQRHAFVVCLISAAIITPTGDAVNLSLMAGPMFLCYELGVLAVWLIERRRKKAEAAALLPPAPAG